MQPPCGGVHILRGLALSSAASWMLKRVAWAA
nr:MAG TPA: hypothetical protein [Siphoviridae sp. ctmtD6]